MTAPTKEEIQAGYDAITKDGPDAPITAELSLLALRDPILAAVLARMTRVGGSLHAILAGALTYGLHLGLHIGEARRRR